MAISITTRDSANLTLVGTRQGVVGTVRGVVIWSTLVDRFKVTILALPRTLWTGGGVVVQVPQFPRPLTLTLLVRTANLKLANFSLEVQVLMSSEFVFLAHWTRLSFSGESVGSLLGDVVATA